MSGCSHMLESKFSRGMVHFFLFSFKFYYLSTMASKMIR